MGFLVGKGYDGVASISNHLNDAQAIICKQNSKALYNIHCSAHYLNIAVNDVYKISIIKNTISIVYEQFVIFSWISSMQWSLKKVCDE